jgi:hypothetical protein
MANQALDQQLRSMIDDFANKLTLTLRRSVLEQVLSAMGGNGVAPARRGPGRPHGATKAASTPARADGKRTPEQVAADGERIASYVRQHPGQRLEQIAAGLGTGSQELKLPVIKLLASKTLRKTGQKRGTQYFSGGSGGVATKAKAKRGRKVRRKKA